MKNLLSAITLLLGLCAIVGCGPSKAEIEAQRRADSARIADSVRAVERQRIDDSIYIVQRREAAERARIADSIREANTVVLEGLMKKIAQTFNSNGREWKKGTAAIIAKYGTANLKSTYAKHGHDEPDGTGCYLLWGDYSDGYTTIDCKSVTDVTENSCKMVFGVCYNGPGGEYEEFEKATFTLIREGDRWLIDDIEEDRFNSSFVEDPQTYRQMNA